MAKGITNVKLVGKSYGSRAIKVEPGNLSRLPIPEHVVKRFGLKRVREVNEQMEMFEEGKKCRN